MALYAPYPLITAEFKISVHNYMIIYDVMYEDIMNYGSILLCAF